MNLHKHIRENNDTVCKQEFIITWNYKALGFRSFVDKLDAYSTVTKVTSNRNKSIPYW